MSEEGHEVHLKQLPSKKYSLNNWSYGGSEECDRRRMEGNEEMMILFNALDFEEITISGNTMLQSITLELFPYLCHLTVSHCDKLESFSAPEDPHRSPLHASLEIKLWPNLTRLELVNCSNLKSLPQDMHNHFQSLEHLKITSCGKIESFPGGLPANLQSLVISGCDDKLIGGRLQWGLQKLNALSLLSLGSYVGDDLDSFPEQILLLLTLKYLSISNFENLKSINYEGLQHLTSLAELEINYCAKLQSLPEGLPPSLSVLGICKCPLLVKRCERGKGEDWPKISRISTITINSIKI